jgi:hypothetical protein
LLSHFSNVGRATLSQHNINANGLGDDCDVIRAPSAKFVTKILKTWAEESKRTRDGGQQSAGGSSSDGSGVGGSDSSASEVGEGAAAASVGHHDDAACGDGHKVPRTATTAVANATHVVNGKAYRFRTVLVDPPRAGLDDATRSHVRRYRNILFVVSIFFFVNTVSHMCRFCALTMRRYRTILSQHCRMRRSHTPTPIIPSCRSPLQQLSVSAVERNCNVQYCAFPLMICVCDTRMAFVHCKGTFRATPKRYDGTLKVSQQHTLFDRGASSITFPARPTLRRPCILLLGLAGATQGDNGTDTHPTRGQQQTLRIFCFFIHFILKDLQHWQRL